MDHETNDTFMDGSIYRIRLKNFLTYTNAEFFPGPRLNLVLGPNGTGKSSIVCGLCIGLAGSPKLLGRADHIGEFIQHKKSQGFTEIELYFDGGKGNKIIRRDITRRGTSTWKINGRTVTYKQVMENMKKWNIQIDNLCQFLPQDKVGDFSKMNSKQLLRATEAAVGDGSLDKIHEQLIEQQNSSIFDVKEVDALKQKIDEMEKANAVREREVEKYREYQRRMKENDHLGKKLLWLDVEEREEKLAATKKQIEELKEKCTKLTNQTLDPLKKRLKRATTALGAAEERTSEMFATKKKQTSILRNAQDKIVHAKTKRDETLLKMEHIKSNRQELQYKLQSEQQKYEQLLEHQLDEEGIQALQAEKKQFEAEKRAIETGSADLASKVENSARQVEIFRRSIRDKENSLQQMRNVKVQQRKSLENMDMNCIKALEWIENNEDKFSRKIWGPIGLEIEVPEKNAASAVESALGFNIMTSFVTECRHDYNLLVSEFNDRLKMKITIYNIEGGESTEKPARPYSDEKMAELKSRFGIAGYVEEKIKASSVVLNCLRSNSGLGVALMGTQKTEDKINTGESIFDHFRSSKTRNSTIITNQKKYSLSVSRYGDNNISTMVHEVDSARLLGGSRVQLDGQSELEDGLQEAKKMFDSKNQGLQDCKAEHRQAKDGMLVIEKKIGGVRSALKDARKVHMTIQQSQEAIQSLEAQLQRDVTQEETSVLLMLKNLRTKIVNNVLLMSKHYANLSKATMQHSVSRMNVSYLKCDVETTQQEYDNGKNSLSAMKNQYIQAKAAMQTEEQQVEQARKEAETVAPLTEFKGIFTKLSDDKVEISSLIANNNATMAHFQGDMDVLRMYDKRKKEIDIAREQMQEKEAALNASMSSSKAIKDKWHKELLDLIRRINTSFAEFFKEIGCVGEVVLVDSPEDIANWGVDRMVQFRDNSTLSCMNAQEHSGGEKSVGTIMYMMALQSITNCPFRVVDEINQGMDAVNERKVFKRITKSSCGNLLPQYFLITPKLITGLEYHRDVKVLVILNGTGGLPQKDWNINEFLSKRRGLLDNTPNKKLKLTPVAG